MTGTHTIHISTDGSFLLGARPVTGWAWVDHTTGLHDCGGSLGGNIQLGELCAILQALRSHPGAEKLVIESDSRAAIEYSTKRESTWSQTGWVKDNGNPAPYFLSVIRAIHMEMEEREGPIDFVWVKGHAGDKFNEQADRFARRYATMCRDFHAPSKIPSEAQIDLMRVPLQLAGRVIQTGTDDMMQALDPDNSAAAKADASRATVAAANTVGVVPVEVRGTAGSTDDHAATSPTGNTTGSAAGSDTADTTVAKSEGAKPGTAKTKGAKTKATKTKVAKAEVTKAEAAKAEAAKIEVTKASAMTAAKSGTDAAATGTQTTDTATATRTRPSVDSLSSTDFQPSADSDSQDGFPQAQLLHDLTATLRKATHAQQEAAERYAKAAGIPPSARVADAEDNLNKAAKRQESLAQVIRELVETLI
ncbi:RNase H family protein [Pseudoscardovia suis]|uniref:ribonuclease H n=1 Tax=Pseudoscardovia suis TaxID=987063 RepID=A0A261EV44_9BIFI|nr:RNase H family protein [Pseudoscardovia suis]OZG50526.1 ribonuclease H [Pseudoscardovia suis]PJJ65891.1 ribonuclease HI [Pseudoscardovia suis]